jgi:hypothetical protein
MFIPALRVQVPLNKEQFSSVVKNMFANVVEQQPRQPVEKDLGKAQFRRNDTLPRYLLCRPDGAGIPE